MKESSADGVDSYQPTKNPSSLFISAKINQVPTQVMFDSGSSRSFIKKSALSRTSHLPIQPQQQQYYLADGNTRFEVLGVVKIFIEFNRLTTSIVVSVVNSLCVDCILGMDYIDKYQVNLDYKHKQVQIHAYDQQVTTLMNNREDNISTSCRTFNIVTIYPYQERRIKIVLQVSCRQMIFTPSSHLFPQTGLVIPHSLISVNNHIAWISVYNSTDVHQRLQRNVVIGTVVPYSSSHFISTIFNSQTKIRIDEDQTQSLTSTSEHHIRNLSNHIQDPEQVKQLQVVLSRHHQLFDLTKATIAQTTIPHVICTGDKPPTTSRPYPTND